MNKIFVFTLILCSFFTAYPQQDLVNTIMNLKSSNDSLRKEVIKPLNDSIARLNTTLNAKIIQNKLLIDENIDIKSKNDDLNKNKIKNQRDDLLIKTDTLSRSITELKKTISEKNSLIKVERDILLIKADSLSAKIIELERIISQREDQKVKEQESVGLEISGLIIQMCKMSFDESIKYYTLNSVEDDLSIFINNQEIQNKLQELKMYFTAEQVLSEKYDEEKVKIAQNQIANLEQTKLVKNLANRISDYKICNSSLRAAIIKIVEMDKRLIANDNNKQMLKLSDILLVLDKWSQNYIFSYSDYPYLSNIVFEIQKLKHSNANTDIKNYLDKL